MAALSKASPSSIKVALRHMCSGVVAPDRHHVTIERKMNEKVQNAPEGFDFKSSQKTRAGMDGPSKKPPRKGNDTSIDGVDKGCITWTDYVDLKMTPTVNQGEDDSKVQEGEDERKAQELRDQPEDGSDDAHTPIIRKSNEHHHQETMPRVSDSKSRRMQAKQGSALVRRLSHTLRKSLPFSEKQPTAWYVRKTNSVEEPRINGKSRNVMQMVFFDYDGLPEDEEKLEEPPEDKEHLDESPDDEEHLEEPPEDEEQAEESPEDEEEKLED